MENILHQAHPADAGPAGPAAAHPAPAEVARPALAVPAEEAHAGAGVHVSSEEQNAEIAGLRQRIAELEGHPPAEDLPELTPYPRTRYLIQDSLDRTADHMLRNRRLREIKPRPNFLERILKIPLLAGLVAPAGRTALPFGAATVTDFYGKIKTAGDLTRAGGAFAASTVSPAATSGVFAALGRGTVDAGKWIMRKYNTIHVLGDEMRRRTENNFSKGKLEFNHLFNDNGDIAQLVELRQEMAEGVDADRLGLHRDEMRRLIKKAVEARMDKLSLERILPHNSRLFVDHDERLKFENIEIAYEAAGQLYRQGLDRQQKASLLWELRQSLPTKDRIRHTTLIMKRMGVFALGGAAVGAATSLVKSLSETGLLADWGNRVGKGIKKGAEYLGKTAGNLYNGVTSK